MNNDGWGLHGRECRGMFSLYVNERRINQERFRNKWERKTIMEKWEAAHRYKSLPHYFTILFDEICFLDDN